jgi:glutamate 5-kinase
VAARKKRIVFKVGTSTLCHGGKGLNFRNIENLARALADVKNAGDDVVLVSSGAIGAGVGKLNLPERPAELRMKQAVASVGQCELIHIYDKFFGEYGAAVGQILLTKDDVERPAARSNLLATFEALISLGAIPVVNENDAVAFEEIETERHHVLGDNDTLSAIVASLLEADLLVILSDIDGLFDGDPRREPGARLISEVAEIDARIEALAGGVGSALGTGGMVTKLAAVRIAAAAGIDVVITNGADTRNIYAAAAGESVGTLFRGKH